MLVLLCLFCLSVIPYNIHSMPSSVQCKEILTHGSIRFLTMPQVHISNRNNQCHAGMNAVVHHPLFICQMSTNIMRGVTASEEGDQVSIVN